MINESRDSVADHKGYSKSNRTQLQKYICITNWAKLLLQIGTASFYYKLGQTLLQIEAALFYRKLGQVLLQIGAAIINYGNRCYKIGQLSQIRATVITK